MIIQLHPVSEFNYFHKYILFLIYEIILQKQINYIVKNQRFKKYLIKPESEIPAIKQKRCNGYVIKLLSPEDWLTFKQIPCTFITAKLLHGISRGFNMNRNSAWFNKNTVRFLAGGLAVFAVFEICDFIIHGPILGSYYNSLTGLWRPEMMSLMWIMHLSTFIFSFLIMFIFIKGYEDRGLPEGVRFGIMIGLITAGMGALYQYVVYPIPFTLVIQWIAYGLIEFILAGLVAAAIYRPVPEEEKESEEDEDDLEIVD